MNLSQVLAYLRYHDVDLLIALTIAVVGLLLSYFFKRSMMAVVNRRAGDKTAKLFLVNFLYAFLLIIVAIMTLNKLGVPTTSLIAVLGASSLAIALALRDSLANLAAGVLLLFEKLFKLGDSVEVNGIAGTVDEITLYNTRIQTANNDVVYVPNSKVLDGVVINHTKKHTRRLVLPFALTYSANVKQVREVLLALFEKTPTVLPQPAAVVVVTALTNTGINCEARVFVKNADYSSTQLALLENIQDTLASMGAHFAVITTNIEATT